MIDVNADKVVSDGFEKQSRNHRTVHTAGKRKKYLSVSYLLAYEFHLVRHEVLHVPVGFCLAGVEHETLDGVLDELLIISELRKFYLAESLVVACCHYRISCFVYFRKDIDSHTIDYIVGPAVYDDTFYIWQGFQLCCSYVVRVYFAIYA